MNKKNSDTLNQQSTAMAKNSKKNIKAVKKLRVLLHILHNPQGVKKVSTQRLML